jgi:hypothetical protein
MQQSTPIIGKETDKTVVVWKETEIIIITPNPWNWSQLLCDYVTVNLAWIWLLRICLSFTHLLYVIVPPFCRSSNSFDSISGVGSLPLHSVPLDWFSFILLYATHSDSSLWQIPFPPLLFVNYISSLLLVTFRSSSICYTELRPLWMVRTHFVLFE